MLAGGKAHRLRDDISTIGHDVKSWWSMVQEVDQVKSFVGRYWEGEYERQSRDALAKVRSAGHYSRYTGP